MKKLLSLLSVLTISGTAVPTTIAASPYQKQKNLNNNFTKSNLETLNRNKRENNNKIKGILKSVINSEDGFSLGISLNNKVYFVSDKKVYQYDPKTGQQNIVITTNSSIYSLGFAYDKIYFSSYENDRKGRVYEYNPITDNKKVVITSNDYIDSSGVVLNNKIYFCSSNGNLYQYDPKINQQENIIVINSSESFNSSGVVLNNKIYFGSNNGHVYEYNPETRKYRVINSTGGYSVSSGVVLNNKIYFSSIYGAVYEYNQNTGQYTTAFTVSSGIGFKGIILNNKIYFRSNDKNIYEYNPETRKHKSILNINEGIYNYELVLLNNKIYFGSNNGRVFEYDYFDLNESNITISIKEQIRRGIYLYYKKQNPNYEIKDILNINLQDLKVFNVFLEETQKNKSSNLEQDLNDVCKESNSTFVNDSDIEQSYLTISCSKQLTETNTFQKMNGFSKSKTTANADNWSANVNTKITTKASGSAGIPLVTEGKVEVAVEVGGGYTWGGSKTYTIGDTSTSSDTEIKTTTNTTTITVPSQPVKVPPHKKISVSVNS
ncbi:ETX/MTX2 family pore-forming toxin [Spiroplasma endosymbiont of Megaselia nigra]|uniref:ETX/MTX2 family pore-forming toxin n=1 Tax=Spiroplasma endosymbiont of Megaselia nigra TaxID=2478537 RepID=UPI000F85BF4B|nr:ETX/MTX2 family pore-forming toxin [Spiroplasma endosymbiont of Megaselia nigra]RUO85924.1 hypothetical protein D9R21_06030 [Spiroplasma endosymbiont of Megaselia nigra]